MIVFFVGHFPKVLQCAWDKSAIYGQGKNYTTKDLQRLLRKMISDGYLEEEIVQVGKDRAAAYLKPSRNAGQLRSGAQSFFLHMEVITPRPTLLQPQ